MACSYYDILGISRDATVEEIKKAYKKAALTHHPDKGGDPEKFKDLGAAVEHLTDDRKRTAYDLKLLTTRSQDGRGSCSRAFSASNSRPPPGPAPTSQTSQRQTATSKPPRPPSGHVEIPADPQALSIKELKELLSALGIDHEGCLEKADLLEVLQNRREMRPRRDSTPRKQTLDFSPGKSYANIDGADDACRLPGGPRALRVKVLSLGFAAVGKSTFIKRYCEGRFVQKYIPTIGIDYGVKPVSVLGLNVKVNFFDTSGGDEFKDIRLEFYGDTSAVVLVYDVTNRQSFDNLDSWLQEASKFGCRLSGLTRGGEIPVVVLCANKIDLPRRVVSRPEGVEFASRHGMHYFETSSSTGEGVTESMNLIFDRLVKHHLQARKRLAGG